MFAQLLPGIEVQVMPLGISTDALVQAICTARPDVVCISGVPPQATRHVAVRCRHLRRLFPDLGIMAAVWSDADLTTVRARIPVSDANHVVCTLKQAIDYVSDIATPISKLVESPSAPEDDNAAERISALESLEISDAPLQEVLDRIVQEVAKSLNAPIAVLNVVAETGTIWKSQCGLPADLASGLEAIEDLIETSIAKEKSTVVIEDIDKTGRLHADTVQIDRVGLTNQARRLRPPVPLLHLRWRHYPPEMPFRRRSARTDLGDSDTKFRFNLGRAPH
jgi:hypothetical protein